MDNRSQSEEIQMDDQMAEYTDQLMDGKKPDEINISAYSLELRELADTVTMVMRVLGFTKPGETLNEHIRARIVNEWGQQDAQLAQERKHRPSKVSHWRSSGSKQRVTVLRFSLAIAFVIILSLLVYPYLSPNLPATAEGSINLVVWILLIVCIIGLMILWFLRRKQ